MTDVQLMIIDLDGTLMDTKGDIVNSVNFVLKKLGLEEKTHEEIVSYIGNGVRDLAGRALGEGRESLVDDAIKLMKEYHKDYDAARVYLYPDVAEVLAHFRDKTKVLATNRGKHSADKLLRLKGIREHFDDIFGGDDEKCLKPSACPIDRVFGMAGEGMVREKSVIIGDMDIDILSGKRAGILTCAVTYGIGRREDILKSDPDFVIDDLKELKRILK